MASYDKPTGPPSGGATVGAARLMAYVRGRWPVGDSGIYNPRDVCGNMWKAEPPHVKCGVSAHLEGRACDFTIRPPKAMLGHRVAYWLVANHAAIGVQEVIFDRFRWGTDTNDWLIYHGRSNHEDHVHCALTRWAAQNLTFDMLNSVDDAPIVSAPENDNEDEDEGMQILWRSGDGYWAEANGHFYPIRTEQDRGAHLEAGFREPASGMTDDQREWKKRIYGVPATL